jgi:hypothetical protein
VSDQLAAGDFCAKVGAGICMGGSIDVQINDREKPLARGMPPVILMTYLLYALSCPE